MRANQDQRRGSPLRIDGAEVRIVRLPLVTPFTIATGTMYDKLFPLLILKSDGLEGYGEGVMDPLPDYLDETLIGSMSLVRDVLLPKVVGQSFENPEDLEQILIGWRGHYMAKAMVEMAFWDLWAKSLGLPMKTSNVFDIVHVIAGVVLLYTRGWCFGCLWYCVAVCW